MSILIPDALKPLLRPLSSLTPYPKNAQKHSEVDVARFVKVLTEFGWTNPIVAWAHDGKTYISAGHLRYLGATAAGLTDVPVLERSDWTEAQFRAYTIADNQLTKRGEWDFALLKDELVDLDDGQFDLTLTGFERNEVYALVHGGGDLAKQDEAMAGMDEDTVTVIVLETESESVQKWLANGNINTPAGRGRGVLKRIADECRVD